MSVRESLARKRAERAQIKALGGGLKVTELFYGPIPAGADHHDEGADMAEKKRSPFDRTKKIGPPPQDQAPATDPLAAALAEAEDVLSSIGVPWVKPKPGEVFTGRLIEDKVIETPNGKQPTQRVHVLALQDGRRVMFSEVRLLSWQAGEIEAQYGDLPPGLIFRLEYRGKKALDAQRTAHDWSVLALAPMPDGSYGVYRVVSGPTGKTMAGPITIRAWQEEIRAAAAKRKAAKDSNPIDDEPDTTDGDESEG